MPLYEYECDACGCRFELIRKFSDAPMKTCQSCGGPVHKLHSAPAFQFKGTGWYVTDYARKEIAATSGPDAAPADAKHAGEKTDKPAKADGAGTAEASTSAGGTQAGSRAPAAPTKSARPKNS